MTIAEFLTPTEAEVLRQVLQHEGIDAYLAGDQLVGGFDLSNMIGGVKVQVAVAFWYFMTRIILR